jgi:hypothetical protein
VPMKKPELNPTRLLMMLSAALMAALGILASFLPQELLRNAGLPPDRFPVTIIQLAGALYIGFAMLNWSAKGTLLGGIYGRPIVLANFTHFAIGAIVFVKLVAAGPIQGGRFVVVAYAVLAGWFGYVLFGPGPRQS